MLPLPHVKIQRKFSKIRGQLQFSSFSGTVIFRVCGYVGMGSTPYHHVGLFCQCIVYVPAVILPGDRANCLGVFFRWKRSCPLNITRDIFSWNRFRYLSFSYLLSAFFKRESPRSYLQTAHETMNSWKILLNFCEFGTFL